MADIEYTEEIKEAVSANREYLEGSTVEDFIIFLEEVGESIYEGELLEKIAAAMRDEIEGL